MVERGRQVTRKEYLGGLEFQTRVRGTLERMFEEFDVILNLTTGGEALIGLNSQDRLDNCLIWTFCGFPSMSLPAFAGPAGLPFGIQLVASKYRDYDLLQFAKLLWEEGFIGRAPFPMLPAGLDERSSVGQSSRCGDK